MCCGVVPILSHLSHGTVGSHRILMADLDITHSVFQIIYKFFPLFEPITKAVCKMCQPASLKCHYFSSIAICSSIWKEISEKLYFRNLQNSL